MTQYCTSCGTELVAEAEYCGECGTQVQDTQETKTTETAKGDTDPCEKCGTEISRTANRCPQCGYEPSDLGIAATILQTLSILVVGFLGFVIIISWIVAIGTDFPISDAVTVTVGLLIFMALPSLILYVSMSKEREMPTGDKKSWDEAFEDA